MPPPKGARVGDLDEPLLNLLVAIAKTPSPCTGCEWYEKCETELVACGTFRRWAKAGSPYYAARVLAIGRPPYDRPERRHYVEVFGHDNPFEE